MKTSTTDRFLEHEASAAHELLPHLLPAAIGKVVPRNHEPFSVGDVVADLVHLAVDRPPLRLLVAGLPFPPRRRRRHPSRRTEVTEEGRQPPPELRRPPRRCQHRQRRVGRVFAGGLQWASSTCLTLAQKEWAQNEAHFHSEKNEEAHLADV